MSSDTAINGAAAETEGVQVIRMFNKEYDLFGRSERGESWFAEINKEDTEEIEKAPAPEDKEEQSSSVGVMLGEKIPPFNMAAAINFKNQNPHHSTCIETKARAMVGLGFEDAFADLIAEELDPICDTTFQDLLNSLGEDYAQVGNAYMEVVRSQDKRRKIVGLHYIPAATVRVCVEDRAQHLYYLVRGELGVDNKILAPYGELDYVLNKVKPKKKAGRPKTTYTDDIPVISMYRTSLGTLSQRSEMVHFKRCTSMSRWYGFADWLSCISNIELVQMLVQERFDFFQNRGCPEFLLFVLGQKVDKETWGKLETAMAATVGLGNQHKTMAINIAAKEVTTEVHKLAMEGGKSAGEFSQMSETLALDIVSAHRTPPILAGIQVSGKMGATNELPNALLSFQVLVIGPEQHTIESVLASTLGDQKRNGGLKTRRKHFKLKKITDEIPLNMGQQQPGETPTGNGAGSKLGALDTMSRMRTPAASAGGRDLSAGVKKGEAAA